jgi:hypothetical protein
MLATPPCASLKVNRANAAAFLRYVYSEGVDEDHLYALEAVALLADCFDFPSTYQNLDHPLCSQQVHQRDSMCRTIKKTISAAMTIYGYCTTY